MHPADPGQVGADRPVEASGDPGLEPGVPPLLDRQDPDPAQPAGPVRRLTALLALPAGAGREDRPRRRHPLQARARVHRPAHHRRRRGDPQGLVPQRLPGRTTASSRPGRSPSARTRSSARRRCSTSTPRWATGPSSATPPRCTPGRPCPPASAGTAPRRSRPTSTTGAVRSRADVRHLATGRLRDRCSWSNLLCVGAAAGVRHRGTSRSRKVPQLAALLDPGPAAVTSWALLPRRAGHLLRALLRRRARSASLFVRDRSARAEPASSRRTRSTRCTGSTTGSTARSPA